MPQEVWIQVGFAVALALLVAVFVAGYVWLLRVFRQRNTPQPPTFAQRWLAAFAPVTPLCIFCAYVLFQTQPDAVRDTLVFGVLGALAAATSGVSLGAAVRSGRMASVPAATDSSADTDDARAMLHARVGR